MGKQIQINLAPAAAADEASVRKIAASLAGIDINSIASLRVIKRSVDARKKNVRINLTVEIFSGEDSQIFSVIPFIPVDVRLKQEIIRSGRSVCSIASDRTGFTACDPRAGT
jgi:hypothetical protein